jgi:dienelactone hydrolase
MVFVKGGVQRLLVPRLDGLPPLQVGDFLIDRHEVTNREYKRFVDAGGYGNRDLWREEFVRGGRVLAWEEAMAAFRDRTGRPGPAGWRSGSPPDGQEDLPVTGVSWYEAAAYARFVGKSLPTAYQWYRAAWVPMGFEIIRLSNFGSEGLAPPGRFRGMSRSGAYDMAGNAKEWCWNESGGMRGVLGGAWDEVSYAFAIWDARDPFAREPNVGFRLARDVGGGTAPEASAALALTSLRDPSREKPVSAEIARAFARIYEYDRTPLDARVEVVDDGAAGWRKEKVSFAAAYGGERVTAYLYVPRGFEPPHQTVVYFPGSDAISWRSSAKMDLDVPTFQDLLRAGRAVLYPVYKSTYERGDGFAEDTPAGTADLRDHVVMWVKDLRRSIDWVESRPDLDAGRLALYGYSWGAMLGPLLSAVEGRIRVGLLVAGGLLLDDSSGGFPESDPFNFAPLVRQPMLVVNGRYDVRLPYETSQRPLFELLGSAEKRHAVLDFGHMVPFDVAGREMNAWLDRHLGPVRPGGG